MFVVKKVKRSKENIMKRETLFNRRKRRTRANLRKKSDQKLRVSVFRSNKHIYAQIIDDKLGRTIASASSLDKSLSKKYHTGGNKEVATQVGKLLAERALGAGLSKVIFDRGGYRFHGRVKALADVAREGGLSF